MVCGTPNRKIDMNNKLLLIRVFSVLALALACGGLDYFFPAWRIFSLAQAGSCASTVTSYGGYSTTTADDCPISSAVTSASVRNFTTPIQGNIQFQILQSLLRNEGGSSGDNDKPWNGWATPTFTSIESKRDPDLGVRESADLYQLTFGGDTKVDKMIFGISGSYTRADTVSANGSDDYRVGPYAAYSFSKNLYATAIAGYNRRRVDNSDQDGNGLFTDASLSYILPIDKTFIVGRIGHRFGYFAQEGGTTPGPTGDDDRWDNTYYVSGEALYNFGNFLPFLNATWEHFNPEGSLADMDSAFLKLGFRYTLHNSITMGLSYQTELTGRAEDHDVYYNQANMDVLIPF